MMCSMLMFETLKLGIIDLQREPDIAINAEKKIENIVAEAYTTQPNRKAGSRVLYVYLACMAG